MESFRRPNFGIARSKHGARHTDAGDRRSAAKTPPLWVGHGTRKRCRRSDRLFESTSATALRWTALGPIPTARTGFTLVELLVVVAIIALLIGTLLPSLQQSRARARATTCATNLKNLGNGLGYYISENGYYPGHHTVAPQTWVVWPPRLRGYMGHEMRVFHCPEVEEEFRWRVAYGEIDPAQRAKLEAYGYLPGEQPLTWTSGFCYGYNDWGVREFTRPHLGLGGHVDQAGQREWGELRANRVFLPADMIAIADSKADFSWDTAIDPSDGDDFEWPSRRHFEGAEVLFCDGHATWFSQKALVEREETARRRWNNDHEPHRDEW